MTTIGQVPGGKADFGVEGSVWTAMVDYLRKGDAHTPHQSPAGISWYSVNPMGDV